MTNPETNPATGRVTGEVPLGGAVEVDAAVAAARAAFPGWRDVARSRRTAILFAFRELLDARKNELAAIVTAERGKVLSDALGVFSVVHGAKESVDALLGHPDVASVSSVGSTPIARYVYETGTAHGKRVQALGGAKNHMLVLPDADLDLDADAAVNAGFGSAGERCTAIWALVAVEPVAVELVAKIVDRMSGLRTGDGAVHREADGVLARPDPVRPRHPRDVHLHRRDRRPGAVRRARLVVRRGARPQPCEPVRQRDGRLHERRWRRAPAPERGAGRHGRGNVPIPVPMVGYSFGGRKSSLFGDAHAHGVEGVQFFTRGKVVTSRWLDPSHGGINLGFSQNG